MESDKGREDCGGVTLVIPGGRDGTSGDLVRGIWRGAWGAMEVTGMVGRTYAWATPGLEGLSGWMTVSRRFQ
jgi:hypothetical protein